jgi:hypothetical protein
LQTNQCGRFFQHHFLFSSLAGPEITDVINAMEPVQKSIDEVKAFLTLIACLMELLIKSVWLQFVIKQGDTGDHFYVLELGKCEIIVSAHKQNSQFGSLSRC